MRSFLTKPFRITALLVLAGMGSDAQTTTTTPGPEGSWLYTATLPGPQPITFQGLETYSTGGGYTETDQLSYMPGFLAGAGHGVWKSTGPNTFLLTFQQQTYDNSGTPTGISKILQTTTIDATGNSYTGSGTFAYYDINGKPIDGASGTFIIKATRIVVQAANTIAVATPFNLTVTSREALLDGTGSMSRDGKPLSYYWTMAPGSPSAAILFYNTATPTVQFPARGTYNFLLTVTDSTGATATSAASLTFAGF